MSKDEDKSVQAVDDVTSSTQLEEDFPKETLEQLTADLKHLDEQEKDAKKSNNYDKYRVIFLIQSTLLGISYSIIWPTLWIYVKNGFQLSFQVRNLVYGLAFVAYPIASILSAYLVEGTKLSTKCVIMLLGCAEIVGNLIFSLNYHPSLLIIGRFIAGLGDAFYVILMRDMKAKHGYTKNQTMTMECLAAFILGVILSPGINVITTYVPFKLYTWHVNAYNYPGLSISVLFIIMEFIVLFFLPSQFDQNESTKDVKISTDSSMFHCFRQWGYKALFVGMYSFLYTYVVAFFEISLPVIIYDKLRVEPIGAMLLYAVVGTLYAMILMFGMTINLKNQLEVSIGVSVVAKTIGMFGILYLGFSDKSVHNIICVAALVISLSILWSNDDILFINLVRLIIPPMQREYIHGIRKTYSKFAFGIAALTVPFCLPTAVFFVVGPLIIFCVYLFFCMFVVIRYVDHAREKW